MEFKTLAIVGLGTMGAGIAQTAVSLGFDVVGIERDEQAVGDGRARVAAGLAKFVEKGKFTGNRQPRHWPACAPPRTGRTSPEPTS